MLAAMLTLLLTVGSTFAATLDVCETGCTYSTIQGAVDASVSGDEILVQDDGVYAAFRMQGKVNISLRSAPDVRPTLSGPNLLFLAQPSMGLIRDSTGIEVEGFDVVGGTRRGFTVSRSTVDFDDMVIRNSDIVYSGAGMEVVASTISIANSSFEDNSTTSIGFGGHIVAFSDAALTITDTDFLGGVSEQGGAIWVSGGSLTMTGSIIAGNETLTGQTNNGGGIRALNTAVSLTTVAMLDNVADDEGGDVYAVGGTLGLDDCDFDGGRASLGGSVYMRRSSANISDSALYGASASSLGGVLYADGSELSISETELYDGSATQGGCVALGGTSALFTDVVVEDCIAVSIDDGTDERLGTTGNGGLISATGSALTIVGGSYQNGAAEFDGGGLFSDSGQVDSSGSDWDNNEAGRNGGAMSLVDSVSGVFSGNTFAANTAENGGGLYLDGSGSFTVADSLFLANEALEQGGALFVSRLEGLTLTDNEVRGNTADSAGGLYLGRSNTFASTRTHWCDNLSVVSGGAVLVNDHMTLATFTSDQWVQNISGSGGAIAMLNTSGDVRLLNNTFFGNDAAIGAAVSASNSQLLLDSSIVSDSISGTAVETDEGTTATLVYNDWWNNENGDVGGNLEMSDLDLSNVFLDPQFQDASADGQCDDNLWVAVESGTLDAGAPDRSDPDDTTPSAQIPSDMGAFGGPSAAPDAWIDGDLDGFPVMWDCDDNEPSTYYGATELCDGVDNDCDGIIDNDAVGGISFYADADGDDFGDAETEGQTCGEVPVDAVLVAGDCNDADATINPLATEICDEVDNDCNGDIDDNAEDGTDYYFDDDGDDFGDLQDVLRTCGEPVEGYVPVSGDCVDSDDTVYPFAPELCDGQSNDCDPEVDEDPIDGSLFFIDVDGDGFGGPNVVIACEEPDNVAPNGTDCDDAAAGINPAEDEVCNGIDDNCDMLTDPPGSIGEFLVYPDVDDDGVGADDQGVLACALGDDQVLADGDCDDEQITAFAGADELCDGLDNDCDGFIDNDVVGLATWYVDTDADSFGSPSDSLESCFQPDGYVSNANDCDDTDRRISPNGEEMCNGLDDDCDDSIDIDATDAVVVFPDTDQDGQGDADSAGEATCTPGDEPVLTATDCDDTNATVFVGADELCDSLDNDCNGRVDDGVEFEQWYVDGDEDGFGGQATGPPDCAPPIAGAVTTSGDCDDTDPNAFPGAEEIQQDGIDQDCDGLDELPDPDSTRDFEPDEDPDTGIDPQSGCNCDVSSAPSPAWALAVLGLLLGRRRRDA